MSGVDPSADAYALIAERVVELSFAWDLDDVARAAAALATLGNHFLADVSRSMWASIERRVKDWDLCSVGGMGSYQLATGSTAVTVSRNAMQRVLRAAGVSANGTMRDFARRIDGSEGQRLGASCPVELSTALALQRLRERYINSSVAAKVYGIDREAFQLQHPLDVSQAAGGRGLRYRLSRVRSVLRNQGSTPLASQHLPSVDLRHSMLCEAARARTERMGLITEAVRALKLPDAVLKEPSVQRFVQVSPSVRQDQNEAAAAVAVELQRNLRKRQQQTGDLGRGRKPR